MEDAFIEAMRTFIAFPSIAGAEAVKADCIAWIAQTFLMFAELPVERGVIDSAPYILIRHPHPKMLWFGHTDVVPGDTKQFTLQREGDRLIGRGVKDMKGAILPFLFAYRDACKEGKVPPVSVLLTSDEETAGQSIVNILERGLTAPIAFTPDTGSAQGIVVEHKGALWVELRTDGIAGHGAIPWEARNAVALLNVALARLLDAFPAPAEEIWQLTVSPTTLSASDAVNRIPSVAHCILDIRYPPDQLPSEDDVLAMLRKELPAACSLRIIKRALPLCTNPEHPFIQTFLSVIERVEGAKPSFIREHGATDARHFAAFNIPAFLYGPRGGGIHGKDEWVSLSSQLQQLEIYRELFSELDR